MGGGARNRAPDAAGEKGQKASLQQSLQELEAWREASGSFFQTDTTRKQLKRVDDEMEFVRFFRFDKEPYVVAENSPKSRSKEIET